MKGTDAALDSESNAPIELVAYDPAWRQKFLVEVVVLERILGPWLVAAIEHVGSTAVPGMIAKPVIDIMVPVASLDASRAAIDAAPKAGYVYWPYKANQMHWFCKPSAAHRTHHLHLVPFESPLWFERLRFRDALRQDQQIAAEYKALKTQLAEQFRNDREAYTEGKTAFVLRVASLPGAKAQRAT